MAHVLDVAVVAVVFLHTHAIVRLKGRDAVFVVLPVERNVNGFIYLFSAIRYLDKHAIARLAHVAAPTPLLNEVKEDAAWLLRDQLQGAVELLDAVAVE